MKKLLLLAALLAGGSLFLQDVSVGHGGTYRGPGDTVPPGGSGGGGGGGPSTPGPAGPSNPGPAGPSTPTGAGPGPAGGGPSNNAPTTGPSTDTGPDLTVWSFWWGFNKDPYLNLKASIHSGNVVTGSDGFFLGQGEKTQSKDSLRPTEEQIRQKVVPALLRALKNETNNDIITGALIALAKIGDAKDEGGESEFQKEISRFLSDGNQEIAETAAVSLGILANPASIETLKALAMDLPKGRELVGSTEVNWRSRAFATYGLGLIGNRVSDNAKRQEIAQILVDLIQSPRMSTRDVKVAAVIALGLVPLDLAPEGAAVEGAAGAGDEPPTPAELASRTRQGQVAFLLDFLKDEDNHYLIRAHAPRALARLLDGATDTERQAVAEALLEGCGRHSKQEQEIRQSCVLALGQIGECDADELDEDIRKELVRVTADGQNQERYFSLISLAQIAGRTGEGDDPQKGLADIRQHLMRQMSRGKSQLKPWAALAIGVMGRSILDADGTPAPDAATALRGQLAEEKNPDYIGAYAIGTGIRRDIESKEILLKQLDDFSQDTARGYIAVALGLMDARDAIQPIQEIVKDSKYRPELLKQAAIALGLLGDKEIVPALVEMLKEAKGLASQAAIASALGFIGDQRSIDDLVAMLENKQLTDRARGFAAVALGIVADKEPLPWNSKVSVDINYRANTTTLTSAAEGTGLLDIL